MTVLAVKNLTKDFGGLRVLDNVTFSLETGERRAFIGPNGAGKTTLFNIICGITRPTAGEVLLNGQNVTRMSPYRRSKLGLGRTFQQNNLFFGLSLLDNISLALQGCQSNVSPQEFLKVWGLWKKRRERVGELSYGEQRQVELLLALAQNPAILLLDEPTAGISPVETETMTRMIASLPREIAILIIEHDLEVVFNLAERITVLYNGRIIFTGDKHQVQNDPRVKQVYLGQEGG